MLSIGFVGLRISVIIITITTIIRHGRVVFTEVINCDSWRLDCSSTQAHPYLPTYLPACCLPTYLPTYLPDCRPTELPPFACLPTLPVACLLIPTCIHMNADADSLAQTHRHTHTHTHAQKPICTYRIVYTHEYIYIYRHQTPVYNLTS